VVGQSNLLTNGDIEDINIPLSCQNQFSAFHWSNPTLTSPDIFSLEYPIDDCFAYQIPSNWQGFQFPRSGNNYSGIITGVINFQLVAVNNSELNEYIQAQLSKPLEKDRRYCVGGFTSLANPSQSQIDFCVLQGYSCGAVISLKHLGALFSKSKDFYSTYETIEKPDVIDLYQENYDFLKDTLNWMQIESSFIATGNEEYLIYGNFKKSTEAEMIIEAPFNLDSFILAYQNQHNNIPANYLYYYFDDMYVYALQDLAPFVQKQSLALGGGYVLHTGANQGTNLWYALPDTLNPIGNSDSLFVNPLNTTSYLLKNTQCRYTTTDSITVTINKPPQPEGLFVVNNLSQSSFQILYYDRAPLQFYLYNSAGQLVKTQTFAESTEINITDLAAGVYYCRIMQDSNYLMTERVVKIQ